MYKRILVAVDGSETAMRGLDEAIRLAKAGGARLLILHVTEELLPLMVNGDWALPAIPVDVYREAGQRILQAALDRARQAGIEAESRHLDATGRRIGTLVTDEARQWQADLVVAGTHGRHGLDRLLLGSVAERIIRTASVPVLLVPAV